jgi:hypothetical protein
MDKEKEINVKKMMSLDLYKILDVPQTATDKEANIFIVLNLFYFS